jgi:hypothetical protein
MTTERKAALQRRLSMASVPKPPAGLADRIKADIPELLGTTRERARLSSSVAFNMRVAASIILLISSAYLCVQLLSRADRNDAAPPMARMAVKTVPAKLQPAEEEPKNETLSAQSAPRVAKPEPEKDAAASQESVRVEAAPARRRDEVVAQSPVVANAPAPAPAATPAPPSELAAAKAEKTMSEVPGGIAGSVAGGVEGGVMSGTASRARAADIDLESRKEVFGISIDSNAFKHVKDAIEHGERPRTVNVEALINYFAGPPEHHAPSEIGLEVEASPAPVSAGARAFLIRTTIDTARQTVASGASVPPAATDVRLEIELDGDAVVSHRLAGSVDPLPGFEETLLKNVSVTALYEVELRANLPWRQPIATVRLHYRSIANGREKTITRIVHASEVARPWSEASRRHRLATLGAIWGETLKDAPGATDVARRAEELANQEPKDAKARELAMLASASSRLQSSGPTGSGR